MEGIKEDEIDVELQAKENVKDFDLTKLCYKQIFELLNNSGLFVKAFDEISGYNVTDKSQIEMGGLRYDFVKETDDNYYPQVELILAVKSENKDYLKCFTLLLTPFNAKLIRENGDTNCDSVNIHIAEAWIKVMKVLFRKKYGEALKLYCTVSKKLNEEKINAKAHEDLVRNEHYYDEQINLI